MTAKHTPGPWTVGGHQFDQKVFGADGFEVASVTGWRALQRAFCEGEQDGEQWRAAPGATKDRTDDEVRSNGRLLAAATDMLMALQNLVEFCEMVFVKPNESDDLAAAREAIRKALGEEA